MSTVLTDRPPSPSEPDRSRGSIGFVVAAAVLVVGVVGAVLLFGIQRPPALEPIEPGAAPAPATPLAMTSWSGGQSCLEVVQTDGTTSEVVCDPDELQVVAWIDDGIVVWRWTMSGEGYDVLDPETGAPRDVVVRGDGYYPEEARDAYALRSRHVDGEVVVTSSEHGELWRVAASEGYYVDNGLTAPDGSVVAAVDAADRLLVLDPDGQLEPRVWRERMPDWPMIVWQGTPLPDELTLE